MQRLTVSTVGEGIKESRGLSDAQKQKHVVKYVHNIRTSLAATWEPQGAHEASCAAGSVPATSDQVGPC